MQIIGLKKHFEQFVPLVLPALQRMYYPEAYLFCHREYLLGNKLQVEGESWRYTAITCIGLASARQVGIASQINIQSIVQRLATNAPHASLGDTALISWAFCEQKQALPKQLDQLFQQRLSAKNALENIDVMELAWIVTGLTKMSKWSSKAWVESMLVKAFQALSSAYNEHSCLFYRYVLANERAYPFRRVYNDIVTFAQQVYSIFACAVYYESTGDQRANFC